MCKNLPSYRTITRSPIIVALDYNNRNNLFTFVDQIDPQDCRLKIGKEIFTLFGPQIVYDIQRRGFDVFLDLKFHDIPNTCARAVIAAAELGVWMINIHASGGPRMMTAARNALQYFGKDAPLLIAVTVLTSISSSDLFNLGVSLSLREYTEKLSRLAQNCGLDGVICPPQETMHLKHTLGRDFKIITPGIRLQEDKVDDQCHTMNPKQAFIAGVDYMVIGRSITQSINPMQTLNIINTTLNQTEVKENKRY